MNALKRKAILAVILALFAWYGSATTVKASHTNTLVLVSLFCDEPEDATWDEPQLVVSTSNGRTSYRLQSMTRGSRSGEISRVLLSGQANITLYDLDNGRNDWFDADDLLGSHTIQNVVTDGNKRLTFNRDGAYYELTYRVIRN